jgi:hypothetical protein
VICGRSVFLQVLRFPPQYNWNIVESGVKHHNPNPNINILAQIYNKNCLNIFFRELLIFAQENDAVVKEIAERYCYSLLLLACLTQKAMWAIAITLHMSSVVCHCSFPHICYILIIFPWNNRANLNQAMQEWCMWDLLQNSLFHLDLVETQSLWTRVSNKVNFFFYFLWNYESFLCLYK